MDDLIKYEPDTKLSELYIDCFEVGQNLLTRNGRIGNCLVLGRTTDYYENSGYILLTDFGIKTFVPDFLMEKTFNLETTCVQVVDVKERIQKQIELLTNAMENL